MSFDPKQSFLFWDDAPTVARMKPALVRPMPRLPRDRWQTPKTLPDLRGADWISFDVEGWDPELKTFGPGWARGRGHLIGLGVAVSDAAWYFPFRHEACPEQNMPREMVLDWARDTFSDASQPKVGANLIYDVGWLAEEGVPVLGELHDVQFAEALLHETEQVSLDVLGKKYVGEGKDTAALYEWIRHWYGGAPGADQRANFYRTPPCMVGPYAEQDVKLPPQILARQWVEMERRGLLDLYRMECDLIPLIVAMRFAGIPTDLARAEEARDKLLSQEVALQKEIDWIAGPGLNPDAGATIQKFFDRERLSYPKTKKGAPSFTKEFLQKVRHPIAEKILAFRKVAKTRATFIESYVLKSHVGGIIYPSLHPLRADDNGTRSGRWAYSKPNYQNLPSRDEIITPIVRGCVVPDWRLGHDQWRRDDYSQIEFRFMAHFAVGQGSDDVRAALCADPTADYHEAVRQIVFKLTGVLLDRKPIKNINFGLIYGMGVEKLARQLGLSPEEAAKLFSSYHEAVPFVKKTMQSTSREAERSGIITTILGRRSEFNLWGPAEFSDEEIEPLPHGAAVEKWGAVRRWGLHKALNRRLQGSAADMLKYSLRACWRDGVFSATGVPRILVHDETDFSQNSRPGREEREGFAEMRRILTGSMKLRVPVYVETSTGPTWADCK